MSMFRWMGRGVVRRIGDATRLLPFARPDRAPGGPLRVEPVARKAGPPGKPAVGGPPSMHEQHHVHPGDDDARRQEKG